MLTNAAFFAGFAVDDLMAAEEFYTQKLGLFVHDIGPGLLGLRAANGYTVLIYAKPNHEPAKHTVLNFPVDDIEAAVDELIASGVEFEQYDEGPLATNEKGIAHPGPYQAWFRDPAGNILSVVQ
ncbi:MAG TPA: VOC family protein [Jatrophihabitantaceae bacterium]|jgi:catechol 2,3-dioxygenase-like lactoylglutathione lyase family enzyme